MSVLIPTCNCRLLDVIIGEEKTNMARRPDVALDGPLYDKQVAELRGRLSQMSVTAVRDFYRAAWIRCGLEHSARWPKAEAIQELAPAWKEIRRVRY